VEQQQVVLLSNAMNTNRLVLKVDRPVLHLFVLLMLLHNTSDIINVDELDRCNWVEVHSTEQDPSSILNAIKIVDLKSIC
jgi:hypothetical protein